MKRIQRKLHRIGTYDVCKIYFFCFDNKRYILGYGIKCLTYSYRCEVMRDVNTESFFNFVSSTEARSNTSVV